MANFCSHIIMAEKLYSKLRNKNSVDKDFMKLFSLGQDLTFSSRSFFKETHTYNSRAFFINTIKYIKDNNLENNSQVMAYLYGHISHYAFDITIHPFVGEILNEIKTKSFIKPHTYLECEMDKYLIKKYGNIDYSFFNNKYTSNKDLKKLINTTYRETYIRFSANNIYIQSIFIIKLARRILNILYKRKKVLNKLSRINSYDFNSNFYKYINSSKLLKKYNMNNIFKSSIKLSLSIVKTVDNYLYKDKDIYTLYKVFDDTPYDVGVIKDVDYDYNKIPVRYNYPLKRTISQNKF